MSHHEESALHRLTFATATLYARRDHSAKKIQESRTNRLAFEFGYCLVSGILCSRAHDAAREAFMANKIKAMKWSSRSLRRGGQKNRKSDAFWCILVHDLCSRFRRCTTGGGVVAKRMNVIFGSQLGRLCYGKERRASVNEKSFDNRRAALGSRILGSRDLKLEKRRGMSRNVTRVTSRGVFIS